MEKREPSYTVRGDALDLSQKAEKRLFVGMQTSTATVENSAEIP